MDPVSIGVLGVVALLILLFLRVPVGVSMIVVAVTGNMILSSPGPALYKLGIDAISLTQNYGISLIPLFILMGMFLAQAGLGGALFEFINFFVRRFRGGMAIATLGASAGFGAVCGSVVAGVSTITSVSVPEMIKNKYNPGFSAGVSSAGSAVGVVIPPSSGLVIYGILTEESIGQVMIGGIIPGFFTILLLILTVPLVLLWKKDLAPAGDKGKYPFPWDKLKLVWAVPVIFLICIGGIYGGFFTPTEAGSVGAFASLVFAIAVRAMSWKVFKDSITRAVRISAMTFLIIVGGQLFAQFLARSTIPATLGNFISHLDVAPFVIILLMLLIYTMMGLFMDEASDLIILTPILYPIAIALGYNGVWFGVLSIMMLITGFITPPVGIVTLVASSISGVPSGEVFKYQWMFWITIMVAVILCIIFPDIIMFLPKMMYR